MRRPARNLALLVAVAVITAACGTAGGRAARPKLRLGHLPNITHATAVAGVERGLFAKELEDVDLQVQTFNAGTQAVQALFAEGLDVAYLGPSPAINAHARSDGRAIRIIAGAASGGAFFVVQPDIDDIDGLRGKIVSSPQLGNTQDVALRAWLVAQGLRTDFRGAGDLTVQPQENAQILETFRSRRIAGAWVAEPWATRMIHEGGGKVLVDERDLWPKGRYVTTHLLVRTEYLEDNPDVVARLLRAHVAADRFVREDEAAPRVVNEGIEKITDKALPDEVLDDAWKNLTFTVDPIASSLERSADEAVALGLLENDADLRGIYDLGPLNEILEEEGRELVAGL